MNNDFRISILDLPILIILAPFIAFALLIAYCNRM